MSGISEEGGGRRQCGGQYRLEIVQDMAVELARPSVCDCGFATRVNLGSVRPDLWLGRGKMT